MGEAIMVTAHSWLPSLRDSAQGPWRAAKAEPECAHP
jgi:hypothetical protein